MSTTRAEGGVTKTPNAQVSTFSIESSVQTSVVSEAAALDLRVARRMFYGGFAALPLLWLVAWWHFRKSMRNSSADPRLAWYVHRSLVGATCGAVALVAWIVAVQLSWHTWGDFGRSIMIVIPEGDEFS